MAMRRAVLLLTGLSLVVAEKAVSTSGSYTAPEPTPTEYQPPAAEYGAPQYEAPQPQYGAPQAPQPQYGAPAVPQPQYGAPPAPQPQYGAPAVPQPQYGAPPAPQPQYGAPAVPQPQYGAPAVPQPTPVVQYMQSHAGYDSHGHNTKALYPKGGNSFLSKFGYDWVFTGVMVSSMVILLAIIGVVAVPGLPFTSDVLPFVTDLFKARHLQSARSLAGSLLGELQMTDVADAVNYVETAIERARSFIADFPQ